MLYKEIEDKLLNGDYSKKNIRDTIKKLKNNDIDNVKIEEYITYTSAFNWANNFLRWGIYGIGIIGFIAVAAFLLEYIPIYKFIPYFLGAGVLFTPSLYFILIDTKKIKKKVIGILYNELDKIKDQEKKKIARLDKASLNIEDNNVKMIYDCAKVINRIKYEGWEKDLEELESLYKEYMDIQVKRKLSKEAMLNSRELELGSRIGEISSKLEIIKLEFALRNNTFVRKAYMKITELKKLNYNGVTEHIELLNNLVKEYILYKRTVPINEKADFDEEELKKEAEFEKEYEDICYLIKVYQKKDQNDKILGSMFDIARGVKLDDSVVNLDVGLDNGTSLELNKRK